MTNSDLNRISNLKLPKSEYNNIAAYIATGQLPANLSHGQQNRFRNHFSGWKVRNNKLYNKQNKEYIFSEDIQPLLRKLYNDPETGFVGRDKLYKRITDNYCGISKNDIMEFLKAQQTYQRHEGPAAREVMKPIVTNQVNERWQIDLLDLSKFKSYNNNYEYLLTCIDHFSKFAWVKPLRNKGAQRVTQAFAAILQEDSWEGGQPKYLQSDNGGEFNNEHMQRLCLEFGTHIFSSPYRPNSNGAIERFTYLIGVRRLMQIPQVVPLSTNLMDGLIVNS